MQKIKTSKNNGEVLKRNIKMQVFNSYIVIDLVNVVIVDIFFLSNLLKNNFNKNNEFIYLFENSFMKFYISFINII